MASCIGGCTQPTKSQMAQFCLEFFTFTFIKYKKAFVKQSSWSLPNSGPEFRSYKNHLKSSTSTFMAMLWLRYMWYMWSIQTYCWTDQLSNILWQFLLSPCPIIMHKPEQHLIKCLAIVSSRLIEVLPWLILFSAIFNFPKKRFLLMLSKPFI